MIKTILQYLKAVWKYLKAVWDADRFQRRFGFTKQQLAALYIELVGRDDDDWAAFERNGLKLMIQNTAILTPDGEMYSVVGDYDTASKLKVFHKSFEHNDWMLLMDVNSWWAARPGEWQQLIGKLVK